MKLLFQMNVYPLRHGDSFYPLLVSFCLQITYRKVRDLHIAIKKLIGKVLINLLYHAKPATCIIRITITCNSLKGQCVGIEAI